MHIMQPLRWRWRWHGCAAEMGQSESRPAVSSEQRTANSDQCGERLIGIARRLTRSAHPLPHHSTIFRGVGHPGAAASLRRVMGPWTEPVPALECQRQSTLRHHHSATVLPLRSVAALEDSEP